jgi:hypothetical protein
VAAQVFLLLPLSIAESRWLTGVPGEEFRPDLFGQLLGASRFEDSCTQGFGVRGGAAGGQAHGPGRRELAVQEAREHPRKVGVTAPDGRECLDLRGDSRDHTVLCRHIGVARGGGHAGPLGAQLDEPADAPQKVFPLDKVEADGALGLVLVRADQGRFGLERRLQDRRGRVDDRVQAL